MDIIAKDLLSKIRKIEGCENAVIAGGFVRDTILKGEKSDIDIFIPSKHSDYMDKKYKISGVVKDIARNGKDYGLREGLLAVFDARYENHDVDIMFYDLPDDKEFGNNIIEQFNYGIDKIFYDGFTVIEHEDFTYDSNAMTATLLNVRKGEDISRSLRKFIKFSKKYPEYEFRTNCLKVIPENERIIAKEVFSPVADYFGEGMEPLFD